MKLDLVGGVVHVHKSKVSQTAVVYESRNSTSQKQLDKKLRYNYERDY